MPQIPLPNQCNSSNTMSFALVDSCFHPGTALDNYRIIETLGQGTFGKVKLAEHTLTKQLVAIKFIEKKNVITPRQRSSVTRELRLLALMRNPNIITVFELIESNEHVAIVMEHASKGELFQLIVEKRRLSDSLARMLFTQIVSAIEYCHQHSVIHRDLKPENLLLDAHMNIKLVDFGFVTTFDNSRLLDTYCGSPFYAAPEMVRGIKYTGPEVDVWSLGVILYAMLCGRLPFDAKDMRKLYAKIAAGVFVCPSFVSSDAVHLLKLMMTVNPLERATIEQVKAHCWMKSCVGLAESFGCFHSMDWLTPACANGESELVSIIGSFGFSNLEIADQLFSARQLISSGRKVGRHPILGYYRLLRKIWAVTQHQNIVENIAMNLSPAKLKTDVNVKSWSLHILQNFTNLHAVLERLFAVSAVRFRLQIANGTHVYMCESSNMFFELHWNDCSRILMVSNLSGVGCQGFLSLFLRNLKQGLDDLYNSQFKINRGYCTPTKNISLEKRVKSFGV